MNSARQQRGRYLLWGLLILLPILIVITAGSGIVEISFAQHLNTLLSFLGRGEIANTQQEIILLKIRWPRILMAAMVGSTLALCGTVLQGLFRNPLADPTLIGVSSGASVGAGIAILFMGSIAELFGDSSWFAVFNAYWISLFAFLGGLVSALLVFRLATSSQGTSVTTMLLAGIAISALAGACSSTFQYVADDIQLRRISLWQMGSLDGSNWLKLSVASSVLGVVIIALLRYRQPLNAMLLGESEARHLGVAVESVKQKLIILTSLGIGMAVSVSGTIAFVGLITPHILRIVIGPDHRYLMPASILLGAIFLVLADWLSRMLLLPEVIPIGIVTAFIGAPFFLFLLVQQRQWGID